MSETGDLVPRSEVRALAERIRELEAEYVRMVGVLPGGLREGSNCTDCGSNCTNCRGDRLIDVLLPGEQAGLSGRELANRLVASRAK